LTGSPVAPNGTLRPIGDGEMLRPLKRCALWNAAPFGTLRPLERCAR
jgi:hypothetical protein